MHHLRLWTIALLFCAAPVHAEPIEQICNTLSGGFRCDNKIILPTSAETKYCPNKIFEVQT